MPTATWQRLDPVRRDRILTAAMAEFGRHGYSPGSLNTVAREAGVAKGSLFQYFDDKLDLFTHVAETAAARVRGALAPRLGTIPPGAVFYDVLCGGVLAWLRYFEQHPLERGVIAATHLEMDPEVREAVRAPARGLGWGEVRALAEQAVDRGDFRSDADTGAFATLLGVLLPHLAVAPFAPGFDFPLPLYGLARDELDARVLRLVTSLYEAFSAGPQRPRAPVAPGGRGQLLP